MDWKEKATQSAYAYLDKNPKVVVYDMAQELYMAGVRDALEAAARRCEMQATKRPDPRMNPCKCVLLNTAEAIRALMPKELDHGE